VEFKLVVRQVTLVNRNASISFRVSSELGMVRISGGVLGLLGFIRETPKKVRIYGIIFWSGSNSGSSSFAQGQKKEG